MPSKSAKQRRFMNIVAHSPEFARKAGIPQSVGKDFHAADKRAGYFAGGGGVDNISDEEYLRRVRALGFGASSGRRPEHLNQSRDVNYPLQTVRGWAAGTLGLPGDLESLVRMLPGLDSTSYLPTSDFYREWLPGYDPAPAAQFASGVGALTGGMGATAAVRGSGKVVGPALKGYGRLAAEAARRGIEEGRGPLSFAQQAASPFYAVRPKGGNFDEASLQSFLEQIRQYTDVGNIETPASKEAVEGWINKQLRNYIRKDLGAPSDPLLEMEKTNPNLHFLDEAAGYELPNAEVEDLMDLERHGVLSPRQQEYLETHRALSKNAPLTPWGYKADHAIRGESPEEVIRQARENVWNGFRPSYVARDFLDEHRDTLNLGYTASRDLRNRLENVTSRIESALNPDYGDQKLLPGLLQELADEAPFAPESLEQLKKRLDVVPEWMNKLSPDEKIWSLKRPSAVMGLNRLPQYLVRALEASETAKNPARLAELENDMKHRDAWDNDVVNKYAMVLANRGLEPHQLGRLSISDVAKLTTDQEDLRDAAVYAMRKEQLKGGFYPTNVELPEQGLRWVEFKQPELNIPPVELGPNGLPQGYDVRPMTREDAYAHGYSYSLAHPRYQLTRNGELVEAGHDEDALRDAAKAHEENQLKKALSKPYEEGLMADGDVMGHCLGTNHCEPILEGSEGAFSLRDKDNVPRVTIGTDIEPPPGPKPQAEYWIRNNTEPYSDARRHLQDLTFLYPEQLAERAQKLGLPSTAEFPAVFNAQMQQLGFPPLEFSNMPRMHIREIKGRKNSKIKPKYEEALLKMIRSIPNDPAFFRVSDDLEEYTDLIRIFNSQVTSKAEAAAAWPKSAPMPFDPGHVVSRFGHGMPQYLEPWEEEFLNNLTQVKKPSKPKFASGGPVGYNSGLERAIEDALMNFDLELANG